MKQDCDAFEIPGLHQQQSCSEPNSDRSSPPATQKNSASLARPPPLKICKDSHKIRKTPIPLPVVQYRRPVIIHTYSPEIIQTDPGNFMSLVQSLTGSSDTRSRFKENKVILPAKAPRQRAIVKNDTCSTVTGSSDKRPGLDNCEEVRRIVDANNAQCAFDEDQQWLMLHQDPSSEQKRSVMEDAPAITCGSASLNISRRDPLPVFHDTLFSPSTFNHAPTYQGYNGSFPLADQYIPTAACLHNPCDLNSVQACSQPQTLPPSLSDSSDSGTASFLSDLSVNSSSTWNLDVLFSPYKSSQCIQQSHSSPVFCQISSWDCGSLESPYDEMLYRCFQGRG